MKSSAGARARLLCASVLVALFSLPAWGQSSGSATVQGTVKDASGAVIPGVTVRITHAETGVITQTISNQDGFFIFPPVQMGQYRVRCESTGMKAWEQTITLDTGSTVMLNATMAAGDVSQTIDVIAEIPLVTTTDATDATTLDQPSPTFARSGLFSSCGRRHTWAGRIQVHR